MAGVGGWHGRTGLENVHAWPGEGGGGLSLERLRAAVRRLSGKPTIPAANLFKQSLERFGFRGAIGMEQPLQLPLGIDR